MSPSGDVLDSLRPYMTNPVPPLEVPYAAGVVGDHPSAYSASPAIWNAAFAALDLPATFVPFDVPPERLQAFLAAGRAAPGLLGLTVTVPYKERVLLFLDRIPAEVAAIGAVNVIARALRGGWEGFNTDGEGALSALRSLISGQTGGAHRTFLLLGAGGAAKAVGVALGRAFPEAALALSNRSRERGEATAQTIRAARARAGEPGGPVMVSAPGEWERVLPRVDVIVNTTSVGMKGPIRTDRGVTWLEPFSPLAPADPPSVPAAPADGTTPREWWERAWPAIAANLEGSLQRALRLPAEAVVLDLVYAPAETVLLKHARWTGHGGANGLEVLVGQAVAAFARICGPLLDGLERDGLPERVAKAMRAALR
ncbi:MAG: shikimate dehydrogenase family protein [bacterium]